MTWDPITSPVDYVLVAGQRSPGTTEVQGAGSPREWEKRKSRGRSGASLVYVGLDLAEFALVTRVTTPEEYQAYRQWLSSFAVRPPTGEEAAAVAVWHPFLEECSIAAAVVKDTPQPEQLADGEWTLKVVMTEYREPRRALTRARGADDSPDATAIAEARRNRDAARAARDQARRTGR